GTARQGGHSRWSHPCWPELSTTFPGGAPSGESFNFLEDCETPAYIYCMVGRRVLPVVPLFLASIPCAFGQLPKRLEKCLPYPTLAQEIREMQPAPDFLSQCGIGQAFLQQIGRAHV